MKKLSFENSGKKIKIIANIIFLIEVTVSIIFFIICLFGAFADNKYFLFFIGFIVLVLGTFVSWFSILPLYALGDIQEKIEHIDNVINKN